MRWVAGEGEREGGTWGCGCIKGVLFGWLYCGEACDERAMLDTVRQMNHVGCHKAV